MLKSLAQPIAVGGHRANGVFRLTYRLHELELALTPGGATILAVAAGDQSEELLLGGGGEGRQTRRKLKNHAKRTRGAFGVECQRSEHAQALVEEARLAKQRRQQRFRGLL